MTLALGLFLDPPHTPPTLTTLLDTADHLLKFAGLVSLAYLIGMGLSHRAGTRLGQEIQKKLRESQGKPNIKPLSDGADPTPFWKDQTLIQGGLRGLATMAILFGYVIVMLAVFRPEVALLPTAVSYLLIYPNTMAGFFVAMQAIAFLHKPKAARLFWFAALSAIAAVLSVVVARKIHGGAEALGAQFMILTVQSLFLSHLTGVGAGIWSAQFEERFPLVEVQTTNGQTFNTLRISKIADTECRFIEADGTECLIPKEQILKIRTTATPT